MWDETNGGGDRSEGRRKECFKRVREKKEKLRILR